MAMEFKYQLGDRVVVGTILDTVVQEITHVHVSRLDTMRVIERISCECIGGTQLFYRCEWWNGETARYAEGSLVPAADAWAQWIAAVDARDTKHPKA
jgi:hypothetical protein